MEPKPPPSPATALAGLALAREEAVFDLHADLCSGQLSLATAFRQLGLGFDPKVSDAAVAYATQSVDSFVDLFNACVSMQESMPAATQKTKAIRRADGVRLNTVYSGAEPDDLEHERFSSARAGVGDLAPDSPGGRSASSGGFRRPSGDSVGRERRRTRELNLQASAPDESRERRRSKLQSIGEAPDAQASGWGSSSRAEAAASEAARDEWAPTLRPQGAFEQRLQQLERLPNRVQRASRKPSSQRAVSLSKEMQQQAVLPPAVVGTYSCHGLDSNHAKINQDAACICYPPAGGPSGAQTDTALFLVVDGHGRQGHDVTDEVVKQLIERAEQTHWRCSDEEATAALEDAFEATQRGLLRLRLSSGERPAENSGACVLLVALRAERLSVAHVGDCRAVLGRYAGGARALTAVALTIDHTPGEAAERARLEACGAYVQEAISDDDEGFEPARLYTRTPQGGKGRGPGLAMSRSLGDLDAAEAGVVATPTVTHRALTPEDAFVVLASDGIWEFLSSEFVVAAVGGFLDRGEPANAAARYLIAKAAVAWRENEDTYRDDITAVVVYLQELLPSLL